MSTIRLGKTIKLSCWTGFSPIFKQLGKTIPLSYRVCLKSVDVSVRQSDCLTDTSFVCLSESRQDNSNCLTETIHPRCLTACVYIYTQDNRARQFDCLADLTSSSSTAHSHTRFPTSGFQVSPRKLAGLHLSSVCLLVWFKSSDFSRTSAGFSSESRRFLIGFQGFFDWVCAVVCFKFD